MRDVQTRVPRGKAIHGRYIVEDLLGTGGFGAVYRVRDRRVKENVFALKEVINPNTYERSGFAFESEILKRLDHPALPHVYRVFEEDKSSRVYMLMDFVDGPNLEKLRLRQPDRRFSSSQVVKIMEPIIAAISYLHGQQPPIIHRDIKPSNIIVPTMGDDAVLVDFGIAKEYDQDSTTTAVRHCSPGYGSPEHYAHGTNTRTDVYSLAATCYTLLSGKVPTDALYRMTQISSKGVDPLEPVDHLVPVPPAAAEVLTRAMAINSNDRFATVDEFWQAFKACNVEDDPEPVIVHSAPAEDEEHNPDEITASADVHTSNAPIPSVSTEPKQAKRTGRTRVAFFILLLVIMIALVSGAVFESSVFPHASGSAPSPTAVQRSTALPTTTAALSPTSSASSVAPTATIAAASPTSEPVSYPQLSRAYNGTIINTYTNPATPASMALSEIQQRASAISGNLILGPELLGSGRFTGTVSTSKKVQFLVPASNGFLPLYFTGQVQSNGSMAGTYCSYQNNRCNYSQGYGNWHVSPS
jgi:eukaryotic-like serine/threonine-protein kinase